MEQLVDPETIRGFIDTVRTWLAEDVLTAATVLQVVAVAVNLLMARILSVRMGRGIR